MAGCLDVGCKLWKGGGRSRVHMLGPKNCDKREVAKKMISELNILLRLRFNSTKVTERPYV